VQTIHHRAAHPMREHKMLIAMAVLAGVYCLGAPMAGNLLAHFGF
jgi:hypothetical protein